MDYPEVSGWKLLLLLAFYNVTLSIEILIGLALISQLSLNEAIIVWTGSELLTNTILSPSPSRQLPPISCPTTYFLKAVAILFLEGSFHLLMAGYFHSASAFDFPTLFALSVIIPSCLQHLTNSFTAPRSLRFGSMLLALFLLFSSFTSPLIPLIGLAQLGLHWALHLSPLDQYPLTLILLFLIAVAIWLLNRSLVLDLIYLSIALIMLTAGKIISRFIGLVHLRDRLRDHWCSDKALGLGFSVFSLLTSLWCLKAESKETWWAEITWVGSMAMCSLLSTPLVCHQEDILLDRNRDSQSIDCSA